MRICHNCNTELPDRAKFCFNCGVRQIEKQAVETIQYQLDFNVEIEKQISSFFLETLKRRIDEEHETSKQKDYLELLYQSGFRDTVHLRVKQLAEEAKKMHSVVGTTDFQISFFLEEQLEDLLDFFIIHYCQKLNKVQLPEAILKYQSRKKTEIDLFQMVLDYLDLAREKETFYTDFLAMPIQKLKNASKSFLFPARDERILLICDQTFFGSCKEGFALTEVALYWKTPLEKARKVYYKSLYETKRHKDWLTLNGHFFNVNPTLNLKMLKLLKKMKRLDTERGED